MKIKKFDNIWVMGLIIMIAISVALLVIKIVIPEFVVEIAQAPHIVEIGNYIDTHKWAWYTASTILTFFMYYFYCCACCMKRKLNFKEVCLIFIAIAISFLVKEFAIEYYTHINYCLLVALPFIIGNCGRGSLPICFVVNISGQIVSLAIRNIGQMVATYNFATLFILMIDMYIWLLLLYLIFNCKKKEN